MPNTSQMVFEFQGFFAEDLIRSKKRHITQPAEGSMRPDHKPEQTKLN